jgi:hypothetical protein
MIPIPPGRSIARITRSGVNVPILRTEPIRTVNYAFFDAVTDASYVVEYN